MKNVKVNMYWRDNVQVKSHVRGRKVRRARRNKGLGIGRKIVMWGIAVLFIGIWFMCYSANKYTPKIETPKAEASERDTTARERDFESADMPAGYVEPNIVEENALSKLIYEESSNEPGRVNKTSLACGIGQSSPCTKMYPWATKDWILKNKIVIGKNWYIPNQGREFEIDWMKNYIKNRYVTATEALKFWNSQSPHWY